MNDKKKNIIYFVLIEVVTAVFFLIIGSLLPFIFGVAHTQDTVVEYVPVKYTITSTTTDSKTNNSTTTTPKETTADATKASKTEDPDRSSVVKKINLNTATAEELMTIKGIGETYARRIIEFRDAIGGFTYMEQLKEVEGVGEGRYNAWTPYLTLED